MDGWGVKGLNGSLLGALDVAMLLVSILFEACCNLKKKPTNQKGKNVVSTQTSKKTVS